MSYCFSTEVNISYSAALEKVSDELKKEGFGILTEIDVQATLKQKLGVDFPPYCILGACNPPFAHQALQTEPRIGVMLPCNVIVRDLGDGRVEVAAVDPVASMQAIHNEALGSIAQQVRAKLQKVIERL